MANAYELALAAERDAQNRATQASINQYRSQQEDARKSADKYLQSADIQRQFNLRDANQLLSAQGRTGGLSESSLLRNQMQYENTAADIRNNLDSKLSEINNLIQQEQDAGNTALANIASRYAQALASYGSGSAENTSVTRNGSVGTVSGNSGNVADNTSWSNRVQAMTDTNRGSSLYNPNATTQNIVRKTANQGTNNNLYRSAIDAWIKNNTGGYAY